MKIFPNGDVPVIKENFPDEGFRFFLKEVYAEPIIEEQNTKYINWLDNGALEYWNAFLKDEPIAEEDRFCIKRETIDATTYMPILASDFSDNEIIKNIKSLKGIEVFKNLKSFAWSERQPKNANFVRPIKDVNPVLKIEGLLSLDICRFDIAEPLNFKKAKKLRKLKIKWSDIDSLDLSLLPNLELLECSDTEELKELDLRHSSKLHELYLDNTGIESLDLTACSQLIEFSARDSKLSKIDFSMNNKLIRAEMDKSMLKELILPTKKDHLEELSLNSTHLQELNLDGYSNLLQLNANELNEGLTKLSLKRCSRLSTLTVAYNKLEEIDISNCPGLAIFYADDNKLKNIDLSKCPKLQMVILDGNPLSSINISNAQCLSVFSAIKCELRDIVCDNCNEESLKHIFEM